MKIKRFAPVLLGLSIVASNFSPFVQAQEARSDYMRCGTPQEEQDVHDGPVFGLTQGKKRRAEGFLVPTLDYLDRIVDAAAPDASTAWKAGWKAGYLAAYQRNVPNIQ